MLSKEVSGTTIWICEESGDMFVSNNGPDGDDAVCIACNRTHVDEIIGALQALREAMSE